MAGTRTIQTLSILGLALAATVGTQAQTLSEPPNAAATIEESAGRISLSYEGRPILLGTVNDGGLTAKHRALTSTSNGALTQVIKWTARGQGTISLDLTVTGSADALAVEADRGAEPLPLVRASIGPSHNLRNRTIYDRTRDWAVSIDAGAALTLTPVSATPDSTTFHLQASGSEIVLRFRPRFYQKHRGLKYFRPWTYKPWNRSVTGWTSWYALRGNVTQRDIEEKGYNSYSDYFERRQLDREAVYRQFASTITSTLGRGVFKLMCWGVRPELIGLFDGCRLGNDGFGYGGFSEYNSFNNIVWRNDPDHIELTQQDANRATTITSLTGSILMLTDPPAVYRTDRVEAARRTSPVLFAQPGQLYDVELSRSDAIERASVEMSGSGPRTFDATQALSTHYLYAVDVSRPYENWMVLARTGGEATQIRFADLGLASDREYLAFEFWTRSFLGAFKGTFAPGEVDAHFGVQVLCLREQVSHPQLVATNRHVSCGAMDVSSPVWTGSTLDGVSEVVANDPYEVYLTEPTGYSFVNARIEGATLLANEKTGSLRRLRLESPHGETVKWHVTYRIE